jgi:hypothetical protein
MDTQAIRQYLNSPTGAKYIDVIMNKLREACDVIDKSNDLLRRLRGAAE